jgi:hypothetical protein
VRAGLGVAIVVVVVTAAAVERRLCKLAEETDAMRRRVAKDEEAKQEKAPKGWGVAREDARSGTARGVWRNPRRRERH